MPLTPEQIVAEEFRLRARGYDRDEVDAFLDRLADQVEADTARLGALEQRAAALEAELVAVRERETTLTRTLATVQDAADRARSEAEAEVAELRSATEQELAEARAQAEREAAEARAQAEQEAEAIRAAAVEEAAELRTRLAEVRDLDAAHRAQLRAHLTGQLAALDALPEPYEVALARLSPEAADTGQGEAGGADEPVPAPDGEGPAEPEPDPSGSEPPAGEASEEPFVPDPSDTEDPSVPDPWQRRDDPPVEPDPPIWER